MVTRIWASFVYGPSQWETLLKCNVVTHCMGTCTNTELSLFVSGCWLANSTGKTWCRRGAKLLDQKCKLIIPPLQRSWKGGILVSPCPSVRPSVCPSVDRIVSALYLQQYSSDPFHICTSYQATSEGVSRVMFVSILKKLKFWRFFLICNLTLFSFDLGSNMTQWYG